MKNIQKAHNYVVVKSGKFCRRINTKDISNVYFRTVLKRPPIPVYQEVMR